MIFMSNRDEEVILLKKLWTSQAVICPKCGNAQLELLHKKAKKSDCDWRCPGVLLSVGLFTVYKALVMLSIKKGGAGGGIQ